MALYKHTAHCVFATCFPFTLQTFLITSINFN